MFHVKLKLIFLKTNLKRNVLTTCCKKSFQGINNFLLLVTPLTRKSSLKPLHHSSGQSYKRNVDLKKELSPQSLTVC